MITFEEAKQKLAHIKSVAEWNEVRDTIKDKMSQVELAKLDGSGYIVKLLGTDTERRKAEEAKANK